MDNYFEDVHFDALMKAIREYYRLSSEEMPTIFEERSLENHRLRHNYNMYKGYYEKYNQKKNKEYNPKEDPFEVHIKSTIKVD